MGSTSTIKILSITKYRQYTNHQNAYYLNLSSVHQPSQYLVPQCMNSTSTIKTSVSQSMNSTFTIEIRCIPKYQQYVIDRNILYLKVSTVCQPSKYFVSQTINSTLTIEIFYNPKYEQYVNHRNILYPKVSTVRQPSKYSVSQSINRTLTIEIFHIPKYEQYVNHRNTLYPEVLTMFSSARRTERNVTAFGVSLSFLITSRRLTAFSHRPQASIAALYVLSGGTPEASMLSSNSIAR